MNENVSTDLGIVTGPSLVNNVGTLCLPAGFFTQFEVFKPRQT